MTSTDIGVGQVHPCLSYDSPMSLTLQNYHCFQTTSQSQEGGGAMTCEVWITYGVWGHALHDIFTSSEMKLFLGPKESCAYLFTTITHTYFIFACLIFVSSAPTKIYRSTVHVTLIHKVHTLLLPRLLNLWEAGLQEDFPGFQVWKRVHCFFFFRFISGSLDPFWTGYWALWLLVVAPVWQEQWLQRHWEQHYSITVWRC